jgi:hypothetical protein
LIRAVLNLNQDSILGDVYHPETGHMRYFGLSHLATWPKRRNVLFPASQSTQKALGVLGCG